MFGRKAGNFDSTEYSIIFKEKKSPNHYEVGKSLRQTG